MTSVAVHGIHPMPLDNTHAGGHSATHDAEAILHAFDAFRNELDEAHDRRERLIKTSRDVTIISKRAIFLLHRQVTACLQNASSGDDHAALPDGRRASLSVASSSLQSATASGRAKLAEATALLRSVRSDLAATRFWRHQSAISPGLQEYIEALSLAHFFEHGNLISFSEVQRALSDEEGEFFPLTLEDYLLGVSDLTGELMRFAITAIGRRAGRQIAREVCDFVRNCKADFEGFTPYVRQLGKKQAVTTQSLLKIEEAAYAIAVRVSEYGGSETILDDIVERCVSGVKRRRNEVGEREDVADFGDEV